MPMDYLPTPVGFHRVYKAPLDDGEVFNSNTDLLTYCNTGAGYEGQVVTVKYSDYVQPYVLKKCTAAKLVPILLMDSGNELVFKTINDNVYALVYSANNFRTIYKFKSFTPTKLGHDSVFSLMVQCGILAGKNIGLSILLEYTTANGTTSQYNFTCNDPVYNSTTASVSRTSSGDVTVLKKDTSATDGYIITNRSDICLMHKLNPSTKFHLDLWLQVSAEYKTAGGYV